MTGRIPIWADVDTGVDDALALIYLVRKPEIELVGVSAVAGNVDVDRAVENTAALLDALDASTVPLHRGAAKPILGPHRDATGFHGAGGLGAVVLPAASRSAGGSAAIDGLRAAVAARPGEITVVALGPLTTIAQFVSAHPEEAAGLRGIIAMTGAIDGGNATSSAEFNCWHDPEAVQIVLESQVPVTVFPLDAFDQASVPLAVAGEWADSDDPVLAMASAFLLHCTPPGSDRSWLGDGAVACIAAVDSLATVSRMPVEVDLAPGLSRGRMVTDRRGRQGEDEQHGGSGLRTRADIVTAVDREALAAEYIRTVSA